MKRYKVLIAPIGSGMAMSALKSLSVEDGPEIIVADSDPYAPGLHMGHRSYLIPPIDDDRFLPFVEEIVSAECVDIFIPCLDTFLIPIARNIDRFESHGVKVMISSLETIMLSRDKWETYIRLKDKVPMPESWINPEEVPEDKFPLFVKPRDGSGSVNVFTVESRDELRFYVNKFGNMIIQEYLPGREFTVDCLTDESGRLLISSPRERIKTKAGICTISRTITYPELDEIAAKIADEIDITGPFFFQAIEDEHGNPRVTELNIRLAGTMYLTTMAGANIPLLATRILLGERIDEKPKPRSGLCLMRYWEEIFIDNDEEMKKQMGMQLAEKGQHI